MRKERDSEDAIGEEKEEEEAEKVADDAVGLEQHNRDHRELSQRFQHPHCSKRAENPQDPNYSERLHVHFGQAFEAPRRDSRLESDCNKGSKDKRDVEDVEGVCEKLPGVRANELNDGLTREEEGEKKVQRFS